MNQFTFRHLEDSEYEIGLGILQENVDWLTERGIRQWTKKYNEKIYRVFQDQQENFVLQHEDEIVSVVSLPARHPEHWFAESSGLNGNFLTKLGVPVAFKGHGYGRKAVRAAKNFDRARGKECMLLEATYGAGFLIAYYEEESFVQIDRKEVRFESGIYDIVLMRSEV